MLGAVLHADRRRCWSDRDGETQDDLVGHAHQIAALLAAERSGAAHGPAPERDHGLPGRGRVVLSCRFARSFVPGLLGGWLAGATLELLPNVQPGTLDRIDADDGVTHVLHDDPTRQGRSPKAIYVPGVLRAAGTDRAAGSPGTWPEIAFWMTTSGTTERPRYVAKSMAQLLCELDVLATAIPAARCVLSTVPLSHFYGLLFGALLPLRFGARIVSHDALLPADLAALIEREAVDLVVSTPAHLRAMAAAAMPRGLRAITSGARMPEALHMSLATEHDWQVIDVLGSTETGGIATRDHPMRAWTCLPGVTLSAPAGRLVVASPWCAAPVELDDRVELLPGGGFHHVGRSHELVKIAGKRADAHAIESTVLAIPGVVDVAVIVHDPVGREPRVALAAVVAAGGPAVGRDDIAAAIRRQFDAVFAPRIIKLVPRIPRTERGKLDGEALRALLGLDAVATTNQIVLRRVAPREYSAYIPRELVFFVGHFEAMAILPGAVLVERAVWPAVRAEYPEIRALRAIRRLRFRQPVLPEQWLSITVERDHGRLTFEVTRAASAVASGQLVVE